MVSSLGNTKKSQVGWFASGRQTDGLHKNRGKADISEPKLLRSVTGREMICLLFLPWRRDAVTEY